MSLLEERNMIGARKKIMWEEQLVDPLIQFIISVTAPREGVIIECPLNGQYHDRPDVIITSRMAVSNNFITVTVI